MNSYFDEPPSYNTCMQIPESEPDYSKRPVLVGTTTNHCDEVIPISSHFPIPSAPSVTVLLPTVTEDRPEGWFKMIYLFCYFKILNLFYFILKALIILVPIIIFIKTIQYWTCKYNRSLC